MDNSLHLYIEKKIDKYYTIFNVNRSLMGSEFLSEAIKLGLGDATLLHKGLTTRLYPLIAEKFSVSPMQVERGIRNLIKISFDRSGVYEAFSTLTQEPQKDKLFRPSNGELISLCCWRLKIKLEEDGIIIN